MPAAWARRVGSALDTGPNLLPRQRDSGIRLQLGIPPGQFGALIGGEPARRAIVTQALPNLQGQIDPLLWGNVRETFAPYIRNGETAVFVHAATEADVDAVVNTMRQYAPVQITVTPAEADVRRLS